MTLEEDVRKLVEWHERVEREDAKKNEAWEGEKKRMGLVMTLVMGTVIVILAFWVGYNYGISQGYNLAVDRAVEIFGPFVRVMLR